MLNDIHEISLSDKRKTKAVDRPKISYSEDAYELFLDNWNDMTIHLYAEFKILLLDRNNRCIGIVPISRGGVAATEVDPKLVFASALKARACAIILGHNHLSSNIKPSQADISLTNKRVLAGHLLYKVFKRIPIANNVMRT